MKKWIEELNALTAQNPELPITMVCESAGLAKGRLWTTDTAVVFVDEVTTSPRGEGFIYDPSYSDMERVLYECLTAHEYLELPETESEREDVYNALEWERAIIVYVS